MKTISISVVSGKYPENMRKCLETLKFVSGDFDIRLIVTDNCAGWDVKKLVSSIFSEFELIRNNSPKGFGQNHNNALLSRKDDYALVINDDIELHPEVLKELVAIADQQGKGAVFGPILFPKTWEAPYISSGGGFGERFPKPILTSVSLLVRLVFGDGLITSILTRRNIRKPPKDEKMGYISGVCCLVKRDYLDRHGLYDPEYYMYYEDIDLGRRVNENGYECWQASKAKIMHLEGSSFSIRSWTWISDSTMRYSRKYHGFSVTILAGFILSVVKCLIRLKNIRRSS